MRTVGHRREWPITFSASAARLIEGVRFNDEFHKLPTGNTTFIPKGVCHFSRHEDANALMVLPEAKEIDPAWFDKQQTSNN